MKVFSHIALIFFGLGLALLGAEVFFRLCGESTGTDPAPYQPSRFVFREPFVENELTGWQLKPGSYELLQGDRGRTVRISINPNASRATREDVVPVSSTSSKIVFVGDSFTFGEGLDDAETLPWRLQQLMPSRNVINHGVGGYGTCQAMFRLSQLNDTVSNGDTVIYGLSAFHERRNIADPRQDYWLAISSLRHQSGYPRCKVTDDQIIREGSKVWDPIMPFTGRTVLSKIFTNAWLSLLPRESTQEQRALTFSILAKMNELSANFGASFLVLLQDLPPDARSDYLGFLSRSGIAWLDGSQIAQLHNLKLPDGHPGPEMTAQWANELNTFLGKR